MSDTDFTTWTELYTYLLNRLRSGDPTVGMATKSGQQIQWRSHGDLLKMIQYVKSMAEIESGSAYRRVLAKNGR